MASWFIRELRLYDEIRTRVHEYTREHEFRKYDQTIFHFDEEGRSVPSYRPKNWTQKGNNLRVRLIGPYRRYDLYDL